MMSDHFINLLIAKDIGVLIIQSDFLLSYIQ